MTDVSGQPAVAALLGREASGALSYEAPDGERLAGYALVPLLDWGVVVERPAALALAGAQAGRDLAFAVFLVVVAIAAVLGWIAATRLAAPLEGLAHAVDDAGTRTRFGRFDFDSDGAARTAALLAEMLAARSAATAIA
jgi:hypothetical protein